MQAQGTARAVETSSKTDVRFPKAPLSPRQYGLRLIKQGLLTLAMAKDRTREDFQFVESCFELKPELKQS